MQFRHVRQYNLNLKLFFKPNDFLLNCHPGLRASTSQGKGLCLNLDWINKEGREINASAEATEAASAGRFSGRAEGKVHDLLLQRDQDQGGHGLSERQNEAMI